MSQPQINHIPSVFDIKQGEFPTATEIDLDQYYKVDIEFAPNTNKQIAWTFYFNTSEDGMTIEKGFRVGCPPCESVAAKEPASELVQGQVTNVDESAIKNTEIQRRQDENQRLDTNSATEYVGNTSNKVIETTQLKEAEDKKQLITEIQAELKKPCGKDFTEQVNCYNRYIKLLEKYKTYVIDNNYIRWLEEPQIIEKFRSLFKNLNTIISSQKRIAYKKILELLSKRVIQGSELKALDLSTYVEPTKTQVKSKIDYGQHKKTSGYGGSTTRKYRKKNKKSVTFRNH